MKYDSLVRRVMQDSKQKEQIAADIAYYIFYLSQNLPPQCKFSSSEMFSDFILVRYSKLYVEAKKSPNLYKQIPSWNLLKEIIAKNFPSLNDEFFKYKATRKLETQSLHSRVRLFLLMVSDSTKDPYQDNESIDMDCRIVIWFGRFSHINPLQNNARELLKKVLSDLEGLECVPDETFTMYLCQGKYFDLEELFNKYSLDHAVEICVNLIKSRFTVFGIKNQLQQYLREELEAITNAKGYKSPDVEDVYSEGAKYPELLSSDKFSEQLYSIDSPNGPRPVTDKIVGPLSAIYIGFSKFVRTRIVKKLIVEYSTIKDDVACAPLLKQDEFVKSIQPLFKDIPSLLTILKGNFYEDTYQYAVDHLNIENLNKQIKSTTDDLINIQKEKTKLANEIKSVKEKISEINREKSELLAKNYDLKNDLNSWIDELEKSQSKLDETQNINDKLNSDLFAITSKFDSLQYGLIKGTKQVITSIDGLSIAKSFTKEKYQLTPSDCLKLVSMLGGERVIILNSAYESASKVDDHFKNGHRLLVLLCKLISFYYDAYIEKGDTFARNIFTNDELASNESETIRNSNNYAYWKDRKVLYKGNEVKMVHHLKIGRDHNVQHTIRVYFFFDQEEKKIVIGYCGEHPTITLS